MENENNKVRLFIAVELSQNAKKEIENIIINLKKADAAVKWISPGNVHLTLKFLGSQSEEKIESISSSVREVSKNMEPFKIALSETGFFPNDRRPKVVWIGIDDSQDGAKKLFEKIENAMEKEGFPREEREYIPHVTLGRIKSGKNVKELLHIAKTLKISPEISTISGIILFKSELTSKGAIHTPII